MMKAVVRVVISCCCLTQAWSYTPQDLLGSEYTTTVNETSFKILKALADESTKVALGRTRIETSVTISQKSVEEELEELQEYVKETIEDAKDDNFDVQECSIGINISATSIKTAFRRCKEPPQLKLLRLQKKSLAKLSAAFPEEVNLCVYKRAVFGLSLEDCLDVKVRQVDDRIEQIDVTVDNLLRKALDRSSKCVEDVVKKLDRYFSEIVRGFEECVSEIMDVGY